MKRGPLAPELPYVPLFEQLRRYPRPWVTAYGAIAAFQAVGYHPTVSEIAYAARIGGTRHAIRALSQLERVCMLRRIRRGPSVRYELLGPTMRPANDNGSE